MSITAVDGSTGCSTTDTCLFPCVTDFESGMSLYAGQTQTYVNGFMNGSVVDLTQTVQQPPPPQQPQQQPQQQGIIQNNLIAVCEELSVLMQEEHSSNIYHNVPLFFLFLYDSY